MSSIIVLAQGDCLLDPLEEAVEKAEYIFIFEVDSLIYDSLDLEMIGIFQHKKSKIAKGRVVRTLKSPLAENTLCGAFIVEWDYVFEKGGKYLLFVNKREENNFRVETCTYSEVFTDSKRFKKLFFKTNKYVVLDEYESSLH